MRICSFEHAAKAAFQQGQGAFEFLLAQLAEDLLQFGFGLFQFALRRLLLLDRLLSFCLLQPLLRALHALLGGFQSLARLVFARRLLFGGRFALLGRTAWLARLFAGRIRRLLAGGRRFLGRRRLGGRSAWLWLAPLGLRIGRRCAGRLAFRLRLFPRLARRCRRREGSFAASRGCPSGGEFGSEPGGVSAVSEPFSPSSFSRICCRELARPLLDLRLVSRQASRLVTTLGASLHGPLQTQQIVPPPGCTRGRGPVRPAGDRGGLR